jgi:hypothetical protein
MCKELFTSVEGLVLLERLMQTARRAVVECLSGQRDGVEVRNDGQDPRRGDCVEGLFSTSIISTLGPRSL